MNEVKDYQQVISSADLQAGDYIYETLPFRAQGPRGGKYLIRGSRIMQRVQSFDPATGTLLLSDAGRREFPLRLKYRNTEVVIRRRESAGGQSLPSSAALLERACQMEHFGNVAEAERLFAQAEAAAEAGR